MQGVNSEICIIKEWIAIKGRPPLKARAENWVVAALRQGQMVQKRENRTNKTTQQHQQ